MTSTELLIETIISNVKPSYKTIDGKELRIRCPFCGDSIKHTNSAHLYISINEPDFQLYFCQRCNEQGIVDMEFLKNINLDRNNELNVLIFNNVKNYKKKNKVKSAFSFSNDIVLPKIEIVDEYHLNKIEYLNSRFGKLSLEQYTQFKIIIDFESFLNVNKLTFKEENHLFRRLDDYCVGFLSMDGSHIIFRSIDISKTGFRYKIHNLNNKLNGKKWFSIKNSIDILEPSIELVLTEGTFDIINIYNRLYKNLKLSNKIFMSVNGKNYINLIKSLIRLGFIDLFVTIYSDSDVDISEYERFFYDPLLEDISVKVFYNNNSKDYGSLEPYDLIEKKIRKRKRKW